MDAVGVHLAERLRYLPTNALLTAEIDAVSLGLRAAVAWIFNLAFSGRLCPTRGKTARECQSNDS